MTAQATDRERAREIAAELARTVIQCVRTGKLDVAIDDIAAALVSVRAETVEQAAKMADEWTDDMVYASGATLGDNIRSLTKTGDTDTKTEPTAAPCIIDGCRFESLQSRNAELEEALTNLSESVDGITTDIANHAKDCPCIRCETRRVLSRTPSQSLDRMRKMDAVIEAARAVDSDPTMKNTRADGFSIDHLREPQRGSISRYRALHEALTNLDKPDTPNGE